MNTSVRVLIAGGGVAALEAALALRALAVDRVDIELVAPEHEFTYRPLSVAEPFRVGEMRRFPLDRLAEAAGARLREGSLASVDADRQIVRTLAGDELEYDFLVLATGARPVVAVPNALTFGGSQDGPRIATMLEDAVSGRLRSIVFALPAGVTWSLPLYELALLTSAYLTEHGTRGVELRIVTPEERPLGLFGTAASEAISELLDLREIDVQVQTTPVAFEGGVLEVVPLASVATDCVVAPPRLEGPRIPGVRCDRDGFIPTDEFGQVDSASAVYAAGDITQFPLKQGGIATQQADAVASAIAVQVGAPVEQAAFRPVLRGLLLTGMAPRYLRGDLRSGVSVTDTEPLWWPPAKIVGRYLAPFLATQLGLSDRPPEGLTNAVPIAVTLERLGS
jgi:sulfide:quinone oxidoreductase